MKLSGGQAIVKMLENLGVEQAFGVPGFQALPYYMAIRHSKTMKHTLVRTEQAGAFAADAYYRACGKVAICDGTCGPGATNLVTGLSESYHASIPVLAVISNVVSGNAGRGANMEAAQDEALALFAKDVIFIREVRRVPELVRKAFNTAVSGKQGPVVIDMPEDIYYDEYEFSSDEFEVYIKNESPQPGFMPDEKSLAAACEVLKSAKKPIMMCGGGIHNSCAWNEVRELAEMMNMPVATTISGKGSISEDHPLSAGLFGRYFRFANEYIKEADVALVVGCKLAEMSTIRWSLLPEGIKIIHVEIQPETLQKSYATAYPLVGDAKTTLRQMVKMLGEKGCRQDLNLPIYNQLQKSAELWRKNVSDKMDDDGTPINIAHMLSILQECAPRDAIMVADGGFAAHWSSVYWSTYGEQERNYIANRGQASIGYGLPAALGAKHACPDKTVITLSGDGGIAYSFFELETAERAGKPIVVIIVNNKCLGYVKALEHFQFGEYIAVDLSDVHYAEIAEKIGCYGVRITDPEQLASEFEQAMKRTDRSTVLEVMVTTDPGQMLPGKDNRLKNQN